MEILRTHEYDISLVRGGHLEGPDVFGFLIHAFPIEIWCQMQRTSNHGERNNLSTYLHYYKRGGLKIRPSFEMPCLHGNTSHT